MRTALTCVFVAVSCLLFGGLCGHRIGLSDKAKLVSQRDQSLKLAEEYRDLVGKNEKAALKCIDTLTVMRALATGCCDQAEKTLDELESCRKEHGKAR